MISDRRFVQRRDSEWWALGQEEEHGGAREAVRGAGAEDRAGWRPMTGRHQSSEEEPGWKQAIC